MVGGSTTGRGAVLLLAVLPLAALSLAGCGVQTSAATGVTEQACRTLTAARAEMAKLTSGADERTVGDVKARIGWIDALLAKARTETSGVAQAAIATVQASLGPAQQVLSPLPDDGPLTSLPRDFSGSRTGAGYRFEDLWLAVGCSGGSSS